MPKYAQIMYDKGFKLQDECAQRLISVAVPPGHSGVTQMIAAEVKKTKTIANIRVLVEQVIRRLKTCRILAREYPFSMLKAFGQDCCRLCYLHIWIGFLPCRELCIDTLVRTFSF